MQDDSALDRAVATVADLRQRCDWDRIQTRETLRPYLVEEAHELDAALASHDSAAIRDEVGDLMLHLAWQLVLASELGEFTADDIADDVIAKMQRRHPHLFEGGPRETWGALKRRERPAHRGTLDGLAPTLPALLMAHRLQERAAQVGFDWPDAGGPIAKVREEIDEVQHELAVDGGDRERIADEIGDLLFACVNLARKTGVDPTGALERANAKFRDRFAGVEQLARERQVPLHEAGLSQLDAWWDQVKQQREEDASR